jgi:hypothetical protein
LDSAIRYQWDTLTGNLELVEQIDGHSDIVYGSFDPKYFKRFHVKRDFLFSRYWRRDQDGSYSIAQVSTTHKSRPANPCFQRIDLSRKSRILTLFYVTMVKRCRLHAGHFFSWLKRSVSLLLCSWYLGDHTVVTQAWF